MLLKEFDPSQDAMINPADIIKPVENFPKIVVSCFSGHTFARLVRELKGVEIASASDANMEYPVYKVIYEGMEIALSMACVGAFSCVALLEDLFVMGAEKVVLFGTCGVLDASIEDCSIIIPTSALRDEGTSFHYAPPSKEIPVNEKYREDFIEILKKHQCRYTVGKVWTTDAFYRETREKVQRRKESGCICVDMECSAVAALAAFRQKEVFHFFYAADNLDGENWDKRSLSNTAEELKKDRIAILAMELALSMGNDC